MRWFSNLRFSSKLIGIAAIGACITGTVGTAGLIGIRTMIAADAVMYEKIAVPMAQLTGLSTAHQQIHVAVRDALLASSPREVDAQVARVTKLRERINGLEAGFGKTIVTPALRDAFRAYTAARQTVDPLQDRALALAAQGVRAAKGANGRTFVYSDAYRQPAATLNTSIAALDSLKTADAASVAQSNASTGYRAIWISVAVAVIGDLFALCIAFLIARAMSSQMAAVIQRIQQLSGKGIANLKTGLQALQAGDLHAHAECSTPRLEITTTEEFGALAAGLNSMIDSAGAAIQAFEQTGATLRDVVESTNGLIAAAQDGRLDARADVGTLQGGYRTLVEGTNKMLDEMARPLTEASGVLTRFRRAISRRA